MLECLNERKHLFLIRFWNLQVVTIYKIIYNEWRYHNNACCEIIIIDIFLVECS